jgi:hypothetical protein
VKPRSAGPWSAVVQLMDAVREHMGVRYPFEE